MNNMIAHDGPLFPIRLCVFLDDGSYLPIYVESEAQLYGVGTQLVVRLAMAERRKIIMEDVLGLCVFHAEDGRILFPTEEILEKAKEMLDAAKDQS